MQKQAMPSDTKQANTKGSLLTVEDIQNYTQLSHRTIRELTANGSLKIVKIGHSVRVRPEDLETFIQSRLIQR